MDEVEDLFEKGEGNGINFIPCVKWVQRGVAKSEPEKVRTKKIKVNLDVFTNFLHQFVSLLFCYTYVKKPSLVYFLAQVDQRRTGQNNQ